MFLKHNQITGNSITLLSSDHNAYTSKSTVFDKIKVGSFIRFEGDNRYYSIVAKEEFPYIESFVARSPYELVIKGNVVPFLNRGDQVRLSVKEYELDMVIAICDAGKGYVVGDVLTVEDGVPHLEVSKGTFQKTQILVNGTKDGGVINRIGIKSRGKYLVAPTGECVMNGGSGTGAKLEFTYRQIEKPFILERRIVQIESGQEQSIVKLDAPLPKDAREGSLSCDKCRLILATPNQGEAKIGVSYSVNSDFTPNLQLPLMTQNGAMDIVYNEAIIRLEQQIVDLKAEIAELRTKIYS